VLGDGRLIKLQNLLQLLHRSLTGDKDLDDPDANGVRQSLEKLRLECLQISWISHETIIYEFNNRGIIR